jgi:hypothetical protein
MAIKRKFVCDACGVEINPTLNDAVTIVGNVHVVDASDSNGVGGGVYGDGNWLKQIYDQLPIDTHDIPVHHVHIECLTKVITPQKRG